MKKIIDLIKRANETLVGTIPQDKQLHALWSFALVVLYRRVGVPRVIAFIAVIVIGILKELADGKGNTMKEHALDMLAVIIGAAAALV